jgi:hypothetical protein
MASDNEKIFVETEFSNIVIVNPNKVLNTLGFAEERFVDHEKLVMYANLQCNLQPRSRLLVGQDSQSLQTIATTSVNFLGPNGQEFLTTKWTEQPGLTGDDSKVINSELLGITNITQRMTAKNISTVDIQLEDIRGRALFESGNDSIYSSFFNLPYPTFYLTVKGYYGKAIRYPLILQKFQASFDQSSGNFLITLNFIGYKFNVLGDIAMGYLESVPNMYPKETTQSTQIESSSSADASVGQINDTAVVQDTSIAYLGYEKLKSVFREYKDKKLIDEDFPVMSVPELVVRLDYFERDVLANFGSINIDKLTDVEQFNSLLKDFSKDMITAKTEPKSWVNEYLGQQNYFINMNGEKIFTYKPKFDKYDDAYSDLNTRIKNNLDKIKQCPTFGEDKGGDDVIYVSINNKSVIIEPFPTRSDINFVETAKKRLGKQQLIQDEEQEFILEFEELIRQQNAVIDARRNANPPLDASRLIEVPFFFKFDGKDYFNDKIYNYQKIIATKQKDIEEQLTFEINELIKSNKGIGFNPTIRNIFAVIFASADAFLRLMTDVHEKAFGAAKDSNLKKQSVLNDVQEPINLNPVYPWPQFSKEEFTDDGQIKYDLKYPGGEYAKETGADNYDIWPEVQFVEEYIKGYIMREQMALKNTANSSDGIVNRLLIAGYDNLTNDAYSASQDIEILYELWERVQNIANFTGFARDLKFGNILTFLQAFEASNLIKGLGVNNSKLTQIYKEEDFNTQSYLDYIYRASNEGVGKYYTNLDYGNVNTGYLNQELKTPSTLIKTDLPKVNAEIKTEKNAAEVEDTMSEYLGLSDKNNIYFSDTYPFIIPEWNKENLNNGQQNSQVSKVSNTSETLFYNRTYKKIVNFNGDTPDITKVRPFYKYIELPSKVDFTNLAPTANFKTFFSNRFDNVKKQSFTEGLVTDQTTNLDGATNTFTKKTTSLLNTQLFLNAIQIGVQKETSIESNRAYTEAAYLFLNSIPISSPASQYLDSNGVTRNYIGPSMKKYGAIHSLPRMFICKIGAIWHRYKTYIQDGTDILENCLTPFNENQNYDPVNFDKARVYNLEIDGQNQPITLYDTQLVSEGFLDKMSVGFYPQLLKDFYFFLNGGVLYENNDTIEIDIQQKINIEDVKIILANESNISALPTDTNNLINGIQLITLSVLFKVLNNDTETTQVAYYSAPSFGSRYNQTKMECFPNGILIKDITDTQEVYNGSARVLWGTPNYGYMPTITEIPAYDEYFVKGEDFNITITDSGAVISGGKIDDILGTFTFDELELFEQEFFDFSKPSNRSTSDFNLQRILRKSLQLNSSDFEVADPGITIENFQTKQEQQFNAIVNKYMNQNFYFQKGNPSNLSRKNLSYFAINPFLKLKDVDNGIQLYKVETDNSVPVSGGTLTLANSELASPEAWRELRLRVGFLNYTGFSYSDNGSFITDFFPDMNIAFTPEMIRRFSEEIKLYATRKWVSSGGNFNFKQEVDDYLTDVDTLRNYILDGVFVKLKTSLPAARTEKDIDDSVTEGELNKLEYYNLFKSINDKWVAGNNYESETLFEDCMFLDRANRDVGNQVIVDIKKTRNYLKDNPKSPLYFIITSIATDCHFQPFSLPSYVNFYNVQKVGDPPSPSPDVAHDLFGTFDPVDLQNSKTKLVFVYTELPSEQMQNANPKNGYLDDSFNLGVQTNNPLVENLNQNEQKTDYGQSNKVVGFAVDMGLQNQSVFTNVQVSQDIGKATSESLQQEYELANTYRGTKSSTQSTSLFNIYKTRSYKATVTSFGNVMIQPTMYFVLRNIPLFAGPYMITDVEHVISDGNFTTKMTGTRQKLYTPPIENALLNTIKSNYLSKLTSDLRQKRETEKTLDTNTISAKNTVSTNITGNLQSAGSPICKPAEAYESFTLTTPTEVNFADKNLYDLIYSKLSADTKYVYVVYTLFSVVNYRNGQFSCFNNNLSSTPISEKAYSQSSLSQFEPNFICLNGSDNQQQAFAVFKNPELCVDFNYDRYKNDFANVDINSETNFVATFARAWIEKVPYNKTKQTRNLFDDFKTSNPAQYDSFESKVRESYLRVKTYLG